jgi:hypothetical protein
MDRLNSSGSGGSGEAPKDFFPSTHMDRVAEIFLLEVLLDFL